MSKRTIGVEEEFHLVDPDTRMLVPDSPAVVGAAGDRDIEPELQRSAVETATEICDSLDDLSAEIASNRNEVTAVARDVGLSVVSSGTFPSTAAPGQGAYPKERYEEMFSDYAKVGREQLVCSCHIQVGVEDRDLAARVLGRVRRWAPVLLALSCSSPYQDGHDTGYDSYRTMIWARWPTAGSPGDFSSEAEYDEVVSGLVDSGIIVDPGMIYFDVRLSHRYPTVEFRIADGCPLMDETIMLAALGRGLVETAVREEESGQPSEPLRTELVRAASWRAARSGLTGSLVHPTELKPKESREVMAALIAHVRRALEDAGDLDTVTRSVESVFGRGTSARRQRNAFAAHSNMQEVVDLLVNETARRPGGG